MILETTLYCVKMSLQRDKVIYHLFRFSSEKQGYFIKIRLCGDKFNRNVHIIALSAFEGGKTLSSNIH